MMVLTVMGTTGSEVGSTVGSSNSRGLRTLGLELMTACLGASFPDLEPLDDGRRTMQAMLWWDLLE